MNREHSSEEGLGKRLRAAEHDVVTVVLRTPQNIAIMVNS